MDIMKKTQTKIHQGSIKNQPTSTKINQIDPMGKYNVRPDGMGVGGSPDPPQSLFYLSLPGNKPAGMENRGPCTVAKMQRFSRWWQLIFWISPLFGEDSHFD